MATNSRYKEHRLDVRVYYENTDAAGVVYHAGYLLFAERGRTEMLRDCGFEHARLLNGEGISFAVTRLEIDYRRAARLDDLLTVTTKMTRMQGASFSMEQAICRQGEALAELKLKIACIGRNGRAIRIPEALRKLFV